jgi:hypothetical protein
VISSSERLRPLLCDRSDPNERATLPSKRANPGARDPDRGVGPLRITHREDHEIPLVPYWQGAEQKRIYDAEHCRGSSDADRQSEDKYRGESRAL